MKYDPLRAKMEKRRTLRRLCDYETVSMKNIQIEQPALEMRGVATGVCFLLEVALPGHCRERGQKCASIRIDSR